MTMQQLKDNNQKTQNQPLVQALADDENKGPTDDDDYELVVNSSSFSTSKSTIVNTPNRQGTVAKKYD